MQHFSNRPYPNFKVILAYLYIIKRIKNLLQLRVLDAFLALLQDLLAINLSGSLDISNKNPFYTSNQGLLFLQFLMSSELKFNSPSINDLKISPLISQLLCLPFFPLFLFLTLRSYERKMNTLLTYGIT